MIRNDFEKAISFIEQLNEKIDVVFIDPPYKTDLIKKSLEKILDSDILNDDFIIIAETDEPERILKDINILNINVFDTRKYGRVSLIFLNRKG